MSDVIITALASFAAGYQFHWFVAKVQRSRRRKSHLKNIEELHQHGAEALNLVGQMYKNGKYTTEQFVNELAAAQNESQRAYFEEMEKYNA